MSNPRLKSYQYCDKWLYIFWKLYAKKADFEEVKEEGKKELTVTEIKAKLDELGIEYDKKAKKDELLALLPQE